MPNEKGKEKETDSMAQSRPPLTYCYTKLRYPDSEKMVAEIRVFEDPQKHFTATVLKYPAEFKPK
jgi:hypothetical protein